MECVFMDPGHYLLDSGGDMVVDEAYYTETGLSKIRKVAMRCRPYVIKSEVDGEDVLMLNFSSCFAYAISARRCGRRRLPASRRGAVKVTYNPRNPGDFLFDALREVVRQKHGNRVSVKCLRSYLQNLLETEDELRVQQCAKQFGLSAHSYIDLTTKGRWGTSLDADILSKALQISVRLVDCEHGRLLFENKAEGTPVSICYRRKHLTLGRVRTAVLNKMKARVTDIAGDRCGGAGDEQSSGKTQPGQVRKFPFADAGATTTSNERPRKVKKEAKADSKNEGLASSPHIDLIFHGSFAPFHVGHYQTARSALDFFEERNIRVDAVHIGFTTERQLRKKLGDTPFLKDDIRARLVRSLLRDVGETVMHVDAIPASSTYELAGRLEQHKMKRSFADIANMQEFFDIRQWKAVCAQKGHVGLSATQVRSDLSRGVVHPTYGASARSLLLSFVTTPGERVEVEHGAEQPAPKSKAMPKRKQEPKP
eukprot:4227936-Amphidinium_carterae.1